MSRYPASSYSVSLGPGPPSPAVRVLLIVNVVAWLMNIVVPQMTDGLGLKPSAVFEHFAVWQLVTYMFLHDTSGAGHLLFNMLALWMFGTDLEHKWRTRFFVKYYFVCGVGAGLATLLLSRVNGQLSDIPTVGASGAIYGLLLAYALYFPYRTLLLIVFPLPAWVFVSILGAIAFVSSLGGPGGGVAHTAHLGGLVVGYLYLKGLRLRPLDELKYRWLRWRMSRARGRFNVYSGGRKEEDWKQDWKKHIH